MFPHRELICYHLTPRGWIMGDKSFGYGLMYRSPAPSDQVVSMVSRTTIASNGLMMQTSAEIWRSTDNAQVVGLMARFGRSPSTF